jgi:hypothetical protein
VIFAVAAFLGEDLFTQWWAAQRRRRELLT